MITATLEKPDRLIRIREVAERLGLSVSTVERLAGKSLPPPHRIGRSMVWSERELEKFMENGCQWSGNPNKPSKGFDR